MMCLQAAPALTASMAAGISDTADYSGSGIGVQVDLNNGGAQVSTGDASGDTLTSIENIIGSGQADVLTGDAQANELSGGAGADVLTGGGGDDSLTGGTGNDRLIGGAGNDSLDGGR